MLKWKNEDRFAKVGEKKLKLAAKDKERRNELLKRERGESKRGVFIEEEPETPELSEHQYIDFSKPQEPPKQEDSRLISDEQRSEKGRKN